jgi:co-chaperonin GroES (HSP10)
METARQVTPWAENVLVLFDVHNPERPEHPSNRRTDAGLYMPHQVTTTPIEGVTATVIGAGPGHWAPYDARVWLPNEVRAGMRVIVDTKHAGDVVQIGGIEHRMVREKDVLAVIDE